MKESSYDKLTGWHSKTLLGNEFFQTYEPRRDAQKNGPS